ncbi:hypothetical protein CMI37_27990 [Candidatus Pacearchaeota archaeon]|jgi:hypothetical protein|nr:hypothetical protein [Candidatus Pacearchaeota archaeon]|tara:strand:+ start:6286 stop:6669 length:384 start_codon:yes stop_codon:yes gene_type:complete
MAYGLTDEQLLATAQRVNDEPTEDEYELGRRHEFERAAMETQRLDEQDELLRQQGVFGDQMSAWESQGVAPENLQRAKSQLARYFGSGARPPVPQPQSAPIYGQEAAISSPTQADLVNPVVPSTKLV